MPSAQLLWKQVWVEDEVDSFSQLCWELWSRNGLSQLSCFRLKSLDFYTYDLIINAHGFPQRTCSWGRCLSAAETIPGGTAVKHSLLITFTGGGMSSSLKGICMAHLPVQFIISLFFLDVSNKNNNWYRMQTIN